MSRRRVLLLLKPFNVYPSRVRPKANAPLPSPPPLVANPKDWKVKKDRSSGYQVDLTDEVLSYLDDRCRVHKDTINLCQDVLRRKSLDWEPVMRNNLSHPIHHADLVVTVGGDGTLLQASHFLDDSIPVLGVNSDPTQVEEVKKFSNEFDATRSTGYLCAATAKNFDQVLDEILEGHKQPSELTRIAVNLNGNLLPTFALNDILVAHPCPATVSRFSFRVGSNSIKDSNLVNCRSSGLRVSTAAGSTAAMLSAGGFPMPINTQDLQYMVREPISSRAADPPLMHGLVGPDELMHVAWYSQEGVIYVDGSNIFYSIQHGDTIEISREAPVLKVYLPENLPR